jgi:hypothetical protein
VTVDVSGFVSEQAVQDKQEELKQAKDKIAGPVPLIQDAPDPRIDLPRGLFHSGVWEREVLVRELTGADEEQLAKAKDGLGYFNTVLNTGVVSIGALDFTELSLSEREFYLNDLLIGEREQLFLKVVQVSFGNQHVLNFTCTACSEEQETTLLLDTDFPPAEVEDIQATVLEHTTSKGDKVSYRAALGSDQTAVLERRGSTVSEQNTLMLSRCITKVNGEMVVDPVGYARSLSIRDRQKLLELLVARQPAVDLNIKTVCAACGADQILGMGWMDFFRS